MSHEVFFFFSAKYPGYLEVVQRPMCLIQVKANLYNGIYAGIALFGKDLRQIFINAKAYNPAAHQVRSFFYVPISKPETRAFVLRSISGR